MEKVYSSKTLLKWLVGECIPHIRPCSVSVCSRKDQTFCANLKGYAEYDKQLRVEK